MSSVCFITINHYERESEKESERIFNGEKKWNWIAPNQRTKNSIWKSHSLVRRAKWLLKKNRREANETTENTHTPESLPFVGAFIAHLHLNHFISAMMSITWILHTYIHTKNTHLILAREEEKILLWPRVHEFEALMRSTYLRYRRLCSRRCRRLLLCRRRHHRRLKLMYKYFTFLHVEQTISIVQNIKNLWKYHFQYGLKGATLKSACLVFMFQMW